MKFDYWFFLHIFHIFLVVPALLYVYFYRDKLPDYAFTLLLVFGIVILLYHAYLAWKKWNEKSPWIWVNLVHVFFVAPLLIWIGFHKKKTELVYYDVLLFLAITAFGYNAIKLVKTGK